MLCPGPSQAVQQGWYLSVVRLVHSLLKYGSLLIFQLWYVNSSLALLRWEAVSELWLHYNQGQDHSVWIIGRDRLQEQDQDEQVLVWSLLSRSDALSSTPGYRCTLGYRVLIHNLVLARNIIVLFVVSFKESIIIEICFVIFLVF